MCAQSGSLCIAHKLEGFFEDLTDTIFDILSELGNDVVVESANANRFGDVGDVVWIPDWVGHRGKGGSKVQAEDQTTCDEKLSGVLRL